MKKRAPVWDPLANVGKAVDSLLDSSPRKRKATRGTPKAKSKGGRPRTEGRRRIVLYLEGEQVRSLKLRAVEEDKDVSTVAREVLKQAGF